MSESTIVAVATPEGEGGLSVVRVSGPEAVTVARRVFRAPAFGPEPESHRAVYGILSWPGASDGVEIKSDTPIDQVLVLPLLAPHSFTGEDTVEFFCHGGRVVARLVAAACRAAGAVPAAAGEFSQRAFLNGKMSLDQAEAVADLIHAESELGARAAVRQVLGGLDGQLAEIEGPLLELLTQLEGSFEFLDEEETASVSPDETTRILATGRDRINDLLVMAPAGRLLRDGVQVVLAGPPNVGKSSLLNRLADEDRAIVDAEPGTTRDVVSVRVQHGGGVFVFHDTAGLREEGGRVERLGIQRTRRMIDEADLILQLFEAGTSPGEPAPANVGDETNAPVIQVATKIDLRPDVAVPAAALATSSLRGAGIDALWSAIETAVQTFRLEEAVSLGVILNERHRHKLEQCHRELDKLVGELEEADPGDEVVATLLSSTLARLGEVSGRVFTEQVLESVFRRFCVGK